MKNYKLTCPDGYTKAFTAMTVEDAVDAAMMDEEVKAHVAESHPEMAGKTPEEMKAAVLGMMTEEAGDVGGGMAGGMPTGGAV